MPTMAAGGAPRWCLDPRNQQPTSPGEELALDAPVTVMSLPLLATSLSLFTISMRGLTCRGGGGHVCVGVWVVCGGGGVGCQIVSNNTAGNLRGPQQPLLFQLPLRPAHQQRHQAGGAVSGAASCRLCCKLLLQKLGVIAACNRQVVGGGGWGWVGGGGWLAGWLAGWDSVGRSDSLPQWQCPLRAAAHALPPQHRPVLQRLLLVVADRRVSQRCSSCTRRPVPAAEACTAPGCSAASAPAAPGSACTAPATPAMAVLPLAW